MGSIQNYTYDDTPIGQGGMGCVYRAYSPHGRLVALKVLKAEYASVPAFKTFFKSEVNALSTLSHPSVVKIVGAPFSDSYGNLYLPMEFVEGQTIESRIQDYKARNMQMPEAEARDLMVKILEAFRYIHREGKIHRDIKPSNIMVRPDGSVCIIDFGIARDSKLPTGYTIGHTVGTDGYMSPEQVDGLNIDHRTDIYSLGCLLYYMMTGRHAIVKRSNDYATRCAILNESIPSPRQSRPDISAVMENAIIRATDKDMRKRFPDAESFARALTGLSSAGGGGAAQSGTVTVGRNPSNDIVIAHPNVSGSHLDITMEKTPGGQVDIVLTDHSTNGTSVGGKLLHKSSMRLPLSSGGNTRNLPPVMLAGKEPMHWTEVMRALDCKGMNSAPNSGIDPVKDTTRKETERVVPRQESHSRRFNPLWIVVVVLLIIIIILLLN